jgi:glycosyltransferase involved in cell wall biosynthesis
MITNKVTLGVKDASPNILLISDYFLPGFKGGGPIKSIENLSLKIQNFSRMIILTKDRDFADDSQYKGIVSGRLTKYNCHNVIYERRINIFSILKYIKSEDVDLIWINSFFSSYSVSVLILKKVGLIDLPIILSPRGELSSGALSLKNKKKNLFLYMSSLINLYKGAVFHSTDKMESEDISKLLNFNSVCIPNLASEKVFLLNPEKKIKGYLRIVFLSRISKKKNLLQAIQIVNSIHVGSILFDIYGPEEDFQYLKQCISLAKKTHDNVTINFKGHVYPKDVRRVMSGYHVLLLPTLSENYGHVIVEAMSSGLIPVISNNTPWRDLQCHNAGWDIDLGSLDKFSDALREVLEYDDDEFREVSSYVIKYIDQKVNNLESIIKYKEFISKVISKNNYKPD